MHVFVCVCVAFCTFFSCVDLCDHHSQDTEQFHHWAPSCYPFIAIATSPGKPLVTIDLFPICLVTLFQEYYKNKIMWYVTLSHLLFSFRIICLRAIQVVHVSVVHRGNTVCLTVHSWKVIEVLFMFWLLGIKLLWTFVYRFLCEHKFSLLWDKPKNVITELCGKFVGNCHTLVQSGYTILCSTSSVKPSGFRMLTNI